MPKRNRNAKVLDDHKKVGRRLVPPYVYLVGEGRDIKWRQRIIPEYLWHSLLNSRFGWAGGADLALSIARGASTAVGIDEHEFEKPFGHAPKQFFGLTSAYKSLTEAEKNFLILRLEKEEKLTFAQDALSPLISLYPDCPLRFVFRDAPGVKEDDLGRLDAAVWALFNQELPLTVSALTNAVYIAFCTNKLRVVVSDDRNSPTDSDLANFPEIENYPTTEASKRVAQSVRMTASILATGEEDERTEWCDYFWNRGLEVSRCVMPSQNRLEIE